MLLISVCELFRFTTVPLRIDGVYQALTWSLDHGANPLLGVSRDRRFLPGPMPVRALSSSFANHPWQAQLHTRVVEHSP